MKFSVCLSDEEIFGKSIEIKSMNELKKILDKHGDIVLIKWPEGGYGIGRSE